MSRLAQIVRDQGGRCFYCGVRILPSQTKRRRHGAKLATTDHYIPIAEGGMAVRSNEVAACGPCNNLKADMMPEVFLALYPNGAER